MVVQVRGRLCKYRKYPRGGIFDATWRQGVREIKRKKPKGENAMKKRKDEKKWKL
jgi:hypothetical protein